MEALRRTDASAVGLHSEYAGPFGLESVRFLLNPGGVPAQFAGHQVSRAPEHGVRGEASRSQVCSAQDNVRKRERHFIPRRMKNFRGSAGRLIRQGGKPRTVTGAKGGHIPVRGAIVVDEPPGNAG